MAAAALGDVAIVTLVFINHSINVDTPMQVHDHALNLVVTEAATAATVASATI